MSHVSQAGVCNLALSRLGEVRIDSLDDGTVAAGLCDEHLPYARRKTLRRFPWSFATRTEVLVRSTEPFVEWNYAYALPADCVRVLHPLDSRGLPIQYFRQEGRDILCNEETVLLKYVHDLIDLTKWDDLSLDVLSLELAVRIAIPLTGSAEKRQMLLAELEQLVMNEARYIDSVEDSSAENNPLRDMVLTSEMSRARWRQLGTHERREFVPAEPEVPPTPEPTTNPVILSAQIGTDGRTWTLAFDQPVNLDPAVTDIHFQRTGAPGDLKVVAGDGTAILTLWDTTNAARVGNVVELSYDGPPTYITNAKGEGLVVFTGRPVEVNASTVENADPVLISAEVDPNGTLIRMFFDRAVGFGAGYEYQDWQQSEPQDYIISAAGGGTSVWLMYPGSTTIRSDDNPVLSFSGIPTSCVVVGGDGYLHRFSNFPMLNNSTVAPD